MIVRSEEDALAFMEAEGVCGGWKPGAHVMDRRTWCSDHCELHGRHVAATSDNMGRPFAATWEARELCERRDGRARLQGGREEAA